MSGHSYQDIVICDTCAEAFYDWQKSCLHRNPGSSKTGFYDYVSYMANKESGEPAQAEIVRMIADHKLWLDQEGGKRADFSGMNLVGANLKGANLKGANLKEANLKGANLKEANLVRANLEGANLEGAHLEGADLIIANLEGANLEGAHLRIANLVDANLEGANLVIANLKGAHLVGARLVDANLEGANLEGAYPEGANLEGANLEGANLEGAYLKGANLEGANLEGANLVRAYLEGANLVRADLEGENLEDANLVDANLVGANLRIANLVRAYIKGANLIRAYLKGANLKEANLEGANLEGANLERAHLVGAYLVDANLVEANLRIANLRIANLGGAYLVDANLEGAYLEEANLLRANLEGAYLVDANLTDADILNADFDEGILEAKFHPQLRNSILKKLNAKYKVEETTSHGKAGRAIRRMKGMDLPVKSGKFKALFPVEYESVKKFIGGREITKKVLSDLIEMFGLKWIITEGEYGSHTQRISDKINSVIQLNVEIESITEDETKIEHLKAIKQMSDRSGHPISHVKKLFTIGWVRYNIFEDEKILLIEEVQSDVPGVRFGLKDPNFRQQMEEEGISPEDIEETLELLSSFVERFYYDALDIVFEIAHQKGFEVEMFTYDTKKQFGSPQNVYTELPRSMGMRKRKFVQSQPKLTQPVNEIWHVIPNKRNR